MSTAVRIEDQVLWTIFGVDCGRLVADFSCAYEKNFLKQGRMYITTRFLCFYSNLFGFEEKLRIPYSDITSLKKEKTALIIDNAIYINTFGIIEYQFRSFWDRDECFLLLERCWHLNVSGPMTFDILNAESRLIVTTLPRRRSESFPSHTIIETDPTSPFLKRSRSAETLTPTPPPTEFHAPLSTIEHPPLTPATASDLPTLPSIDPLESNREAKVAQLFTSESETGQLAIQVASNTLALPLDSFLALFLADEAPFGWPKYQLKVQETVFAVTSWVSTLDEHGITCLTRTIHFDKPINAMGFKSTKARKLQSLRIFPQGLIMSSVTLLDESSPIPSSQCFGVHDSFVIRAIDPHKIQVDVSFEVRFTQQTLMQFFIEVPTNRETLIYLQAYAQFLVDNHGASLTSPGLMQEQVDPIIGTASLVDAVKEEVHKDEGGKNADFVAWKQVAVFAALLFTLFVVRPFAVS